MQERFFYHNFPRHHPSDSLEQVSTKGVGILESIKNIGLVMAPEIIEWKQPTIDGKSRITRIRQKRISFTELARNELSEHSKKFGSFALEFKIDALRQLGALPVIYMPQGIKALGDLSNLGTMIVMQIGDAKYTINQLHNLSQMTDPQHILKNISPHIATSVAEGFTMNLQNIDEQKQIVQSNSVPGKYVQNMLDYIGFRNAPFELVAGVLSLVQTLFYPTDDELHDDLLSYYRQREWRIAGGFLFNGVAHGRPLSDSEKNMLLRIDPRFWNKQLSDNEGTFRCIDETVVIDQFDGRPIIEFLSAVVVPPEAFDKAKSLFGNIVIKSEAE